MHNSVAAGHGTNKGQMVTPCISARSLHAPPNTFPSSSLAVNRLFRTTVRYCSGRRLPGNPHPRRLRPEGLSRHQACRMPDGGFHALRIRGEGATVSADLCGDAHVPECGHCRLQVRTHTHMPERIGINEAPSAPAMDDIRAQNLPCIYAYGLGSDAYLGRACDIHMHNVPVLEVSQPGLPMTCHAG